MNGVAVFIAEGYDNLRCAAEKAFIISALPKIVVSSFQALQAIADSWKDMVLDVEPYKERGHFRLK